MSFKSPFLAAVLAVSAALPLRAEEAFLGVHDAWARTAYPGAPTGAAYFTLHNHGLPDDVLVGVTSPAAASVSVHTNIETADGVMQMREAGPLDLPTDGALTFAPGGNHIMFMGLTEPWSDGDTIAFTLLFDSGATLDVTAEVDLDPDRVPVSPSHDGMDHGGMTHEGMDPAN